MRIGCKQAMPHQHDHGSTGCHFQIFGPWYQIAANIYGEVETPAAASTPEVPQEPAQVA